MANTLVIACPECDKQIKVSEEVVGKKIRCKECEHAFVVKKPKGAPAKADPKTKQTAEDKAAAAKAAAQNEDDDDGKNPYGLSTEADEGVARCPHCTKELESEGALICLHCGYNLRTRVRTERKLVYEPTKEEKFHWLLPGVLCVIGILSALTISVFCLMKTKGWMIGGLFHETEDGKDQFIIVPGCFMFFNVFVTFVLCLSLGKFAYKRLIKNSRPPERAIEKDKDKDED